MILMKVEIERKFIDSTLTINRTQNNIAMEIEKKFLSFLPDNAENYRTLRKLEKRLKIARDQQTKNFWTALRRK